MRLSVQVRERGTITLPAELRQRYGIDAGDTFSVIDLDGMFVLVPMVMLVPDLAAELERARLEAGLSVDDLIRGVREQRAAYHADRDPEREPPDGDAGTETA